MNKYILSKKGCILNKYNFDDAEINCIRADLTVRPSQKMYDTDEKFNVFHENDEQIFIPKFYAMEKFGIPYSKINNSGDDINLQFIIELREPQKKIINNIFNSYEKQGGGILTLPCGFGKTIIALYFIALLKKKTLIIVHREFLIAHWEEKIKSSLSTAKIGIIQGNNINIHNCDIVIVMLQTLALRDYPEDFFDSFGHIIIDECHRVPTSVFSNVLFKINSNYMLGLSATPNRSDGMSKVLKWHIGDIINLNIQIKSEIQINVERYVLNFDINTKMQLLNVGKDSFSKYLSNVLKFDVRNNLIVNTILNEYKNNSNRHFLVLSDRIVHLKELETVFKKNNFTSIGYIIGGKSKDEISNAQKCKVILATYSMVTEGLDIPTLNCLVLASPKIEVEQAIGRISRISNSSFNPLVIDFIDILPAFVNESCKRYLFYNKKKYNIIDYVYNSKLSKFEQNTKQNTDYNIYCIDGHEKIDTEYNNISTITNRKNNDSKVNIVAGKVDKNSKNDILDDLFKSFKM